MTQVELETVAQLLAHGTIFSQDNMCKVTGVLGLCAHNWDHNSANALLKHLLLTYPEDMTGSNRVLLLLQFSRSPLRIEYLLSVPQEGDSFRLTLSSLGCIAGGELQRISNGGGDLRELL